MPHSVQSVQLVAATLTRKAVADLIDAVKATPDDKRNWQPLAEARPILDQVVECCLANRIWANILQTHVHAFLPEGEADTIYTERDTAAKAIAYLQETGDLLVAAIQKVPDADLGSIVPFPGNPQAGIPIAQCCFHAFWNLSYHLGQVSYIQTLYGDLEEYGDIGPFGETRETLPTA